MHLPIPTVREVRGAFLVGAVAVLMLAGALSWGIVHKVNDSDDIVRIAASAADQVQRLSEQVDELQASAESSTAAAKNDRAALRRQLAAQRAQNRAILRYLRQQGIAVPPTLLAPRTGSGSSSTPKAQPSSGTHPSQAPASPQVTPRPSTTPTAAPTGPELLCGISPALCGLLP